MTESSGGSSVLCPDADGEFRKTDGAKSETIQQLGISKDQSSRWQALAAKIVQRSENAVLGSVCRAVCEIAICDAVRRLTSLRRHLIQRQCRLPHIGKYLDRRLSLFICEFLLFANLGKPLLLCVRCSLLLSLAFSGFLGFLISFGCSFLLSLGVRYGDFNLVA